ncbi:alpha-E domain-containing protein [Paenibacillus sp. LMG 31456]|uniref:Alpha-E domain-containing protein n=1 Tax=Paenibacillus foliorum TaxID=2654974 RepID=A0A972JY03_9BACL|nr:alpha-E domain-containing protein [Paenibacillus foliorum]NOU92046.1 alpha-E domain-containing protein [Paenibacillus foliorum]
MLNRNAEALFWVGRYVERAENHARLIDVHYHIQQEADFLHKDHKWTRLIDALGARTLYVQQFEAFTEKDVLSFITLDRGNANSLFSCVSQARNNLRTLREKLPSELWDVLNAFYLWLGEMQVDDIIKDSPNAFYRHIKERMAMFQGVENSVMLRQNEWHFIESGRFLERAENTVRILQSVAGTLLEGRDIPTPYPNMLAVLKSVSGYQSFRRFYGDGMQVEHIMEFMIRSESFPRSIQFSFTELEKHLKGIELQTQDYHIPHEKAVRLAGKVKAEMACLEPDEFRAQQVSTLLEHLTVSCHRLGKTMATAFFQFEEATA